MEFLDEDARPRFVLQSKQLSNSDPITQTRSLNRPGTFFSISLSIFFFVLSFLYFTFEPFNSLFIWLSLSFFIGPFAPLSITGGNIRVGLGSPIQDPDKNEGVDHSEHDFKKPNKRSNRPVKRVVEFAQVEKVDGSVCNSEKVEGSVCNSEKVDGSVCNLGKVEEWSDGDVELLRKMMGKNPVGKPGRWEAITEGFKGRFSVENVIKKAKELGEKKISDGDSYQKFLKDRKVNDKRAESGNEGDFDNVDVKKVVENSWSSGEDLALLNALKTFPKDVAMRWEKIAAAVPGKNKAACMKRMAELKKDFRSSKSANADA